LTQMMILRLVGFTCWLDGTMYTEDRIPKDKRAPYETRIREQWEYGFVKWEPLPYILPVPQDDDKSPGHCVDNGCRPSHHREVESTTDERFEVCE